MQIIAVIIVFFEGKSYSQNYLINYKPFFEQQLPIYQNWLKNENLDDLFHTEKINFEGNKLSVYLRSNFLTDDSLKVSWDGYREKFLKSTSSRLESYMLDYLSFLMQIRIDSTNIFVVGSDTSKILISISFDKYTVLQTFFPSTMEGGSLTVSIKDINFEGHQMQNISDKNTVSIISKNIRDFLYSYYAPKSTFLYNAYIDTSDSYYNVFIIRVSCINKEIISDGYYEYIGLKVEVEKLDYNIVIKYDIYGAYASGILCPKFREGFYTPIGENNYSGKMNAYVSRIKYKIDDYLKTKLKK